MPADAIQTAEFLSFMDQVFDSVNGSTYESDHGKVLRSAVRKDSSHVAFWEESIRIFQTVKFNTPKGEKVPPTIKNWVKTLRGFIYIWKKVNACGFKYLCTRRINQDPVENFFGCIRSHGVRNINPSCYSFICSFKTLIINNFSSPHSPNANCEEDDNKVLNSLKSLLTVDRDEGGNDILVNLDVSDIEFNNVTDPGIVSTHAYIAGYIAKGIKKKIDDCQTCMNQLQAAPSSFPSEEHSLIQEREYWAKSLIRTKTQFRRMFTNMTILFNQVIRQIILKNNIKKQLKFIFLNKLYNPFLCKEHNIFDLYIDIFLNFFIFTYLKNINSILKGLVEYNSKDNDILKQMAWQKYLRLKAKNKKIAGLKKLV